MNLPSRWIKYGLPLLVAIFLHSPVACKKEPSKPKKPLAPDFALPSVDGKTVTLSQLRGKVVLLDFWATWCGPCRHEIPDFIEFYGQYKDKGMEIIGISVDKSAKKVKDFMDKHRINYPVAMATNEIMGDYKPGRYIPTTIIISPDGDIVEKKVGIMDKTTLESYFQEFSR